MNRFGVLITHSSWQITWNKTTRQRMHIIPMCWMPSFQPILNMFNIIIIRSSWTSFFLCVFFFYVRFFRMEMTNVFCCANSCHLNEPKRFWYRIVVLLLFVILFLLPIKSTLAPNEMVEKWNNVPVHLCTNFFFIRLCQTSKWSYLNQMSSIHLNEFWLLYNEIVGFLPSQYLTWKIDVWFVSTEIRKVEYGIAKSGLRLGRSGK